MSNKLSLDFAEKVELFNPEFAEWVQDKICVAKVELYKKSNCSTIERCRMVDSHRA
jgi:hypothetical protein